MRLLVHVEGQTERTFVADTLRPFLIGHGYTRVGARLVGAAQSRRRRGGGRRWLGVRRKILNHLRGDPGACSTTMMDYYGLPADWPRGAGGTSGGVVAAERIERALLDDVSSEMGAQFRTERFLPNLLVHEFEALLFSDCDIFARAIGHPEVCSALKKIRSQCGGPEEIDDSPDTAPSRQIARLVPRYEKPVHGNLAAMDIGLDPMRQECGHFDQWLSRLEALPRRLARKGAS